MKISHTLIATGLSLALMAEANAGPKSWLQEQKAKLTGFQSAQATEADEDAQLNEQHKKLDAWAAEKDAQGKPAKASPGSKSLAAERADCQKFMKDQKAGKVALSAETGAKFDRCNLVLSNKTLDTVQVQGTRPTTPAVDKGKAMEVAGKGCAIGGMLGGLLGVDPNIGCAVGGLAGYARSYQQQIKGAREVETAARAAGMDATVRTQQTTDAKGKQQETLAALTIRYEAADMEAMSPKTVATLDRLANLATKSKSTLSFRFEGKKACQIPLIELNNRKALERHQVINECGKSGTNQIVVSPVAGAK